MTRMENIKIHVGFKTRVYLDAVQVLYGEKVRDQLIADVREALVSATPPWTEHGDAVTISDCFSSAVEAVEPNGPLTELWVQVDGTFNGKHVRHHHYREL